MLIQPAIHDTLSCIAVLIQFIAAGSPVKIKGKEIRGIALAARLAIYNILRGPPSKRFESVSKPSPFLLR